LIAKCLFSLFLASAILASGCATLNPKAPPRIYYDSEGVKAYLDDRSDQNRNRERTCVFGFELVESYVQVKAKLPRKAKVRDQHHGTYGPFFITDGAGYDIEGLESVAFSFDRRWKLVSVSMSFSESGFSAYKDCVVSNYKLYTNLSGGTAIYQANPRPKGGVPC